MPRSELLRRHADLEVNACSPGDRRTICAASEISEARHPGGGMAEMDEQDYADMIEQTPVAPM